MIHEVNVPPGVANRLGHEVHQARRGRVPAPAEQVAVAAGRAAWSGCRCGSPSPPSTGPRCAPRPARTSACDPDLPTLFVSGASQGARSINLAVAGAAKALTAAGVQVLHVIGGRNEPVEIPADLPVPYVTLPYLSEMELGYAAADLVLCRGGAMTCAETTAVGLPAIYVPLPVRQRRAAAQRAAGGRGRRRPARRRRRAHPGVDRADT